MKIITDYRLNKTYRTGKAQIARNNTKIDCEILRFVKIRTTRYEYTIRAECQLTTGKIIYIKTENIIQ